MSNYFNYFTHIYVYFFISDDAKFSNGNCTGIPVFLDLYAANITHGLRRLGNYFDTSITLKVLNDKYTEEGNFKASLSFLSSILFRPKVKDCAFYKEEFDIVYEQKKANIESLSEVSLYLYAKLRRDIPIERLFFSLSVQTTI